MPSIWCRASRIESRTCAPHTQRSKDLQTQSQGRGLASHTFSALHRSKDLKTQSQGTGQKGMSSYLGLAREIFRLGFLVATQDRRGRC